MGDDSENNSDKKNKLTEGDMGVTVMEVAAETDPYNGRDVEDGSVIEPETNQD